jgi:hypothetical protein
MSGLAGRLAADPPAQSFANTVKSGAPPKPQAGAAIRGAAWTKPADVLNQCNSMRRLMELNGKLFNALGGDLEMLAEQRVSEAFYAAVARANEP